MCFFRRSDQSEYHSARDFTPDLDKKIVTWDEENFEQVPIQVNDQSELVIQVT